MRCLWRINGIDKLVAPHLEVLFFGHMHSREGLEEVKDCSLGFVEEGSHFGELRRRKCVLATKTCRQRKVGVVE
jgi:hypothetical protein